MLHGDMMQKRSDLPAVGQVWKWLENVPDPEIPAISLVDLGIIRDVEWRDETLVVTITPTYSGCPATSIINFDVEQELRKNGIKKLELKRQLSPAWTTDWMLESGRKKLNEYGIAPPVSGTAACGNKIRPAPVVTCPRCKSTETEIVSQFGSTPCKASYRCTQCLEPFDYFKCI